MSIYTEIKAAGISHNNHYSDLYLPCTPHVLEILAGHGKKIDGHNVQVFYSEGQKWLDLPFQFDPYWEARAKK